MTGEPHAAGPQRRSPKDPASAADPGRRARPAAARPDPAARRPDRPAGAADLTAPGPGSESSPGSSPPTPSKSQAGRAGGPWKAAFFTLAAAAIVIIAVWAILGSSLFVVRSVAVTGAGTVPRAEVLRAAAIVPGTPLARVNGTAVASRVERITQIQSAQISKDWPDTVVIAVTPRTPALAVASPGGYTLIDKFGVAFRQVPQQPAGMALLASARPVASLRGSPAVLAAVTVLGQLPRPVRGQVATVSAASPDAVTLHLRGGITIVWGSTSRPAAKAAELVILMRTKASYYDLSDPATAVTGG
jgi:cell division protein FtsQ